MSSVEVLLFVRDSPLRARSLLTVRAAISSATSFERPSLSSLSLMCSYWRSRFLLHVWVGICVPHSPSRGGRLPRPPLCRRSGGRGNRRGLVGDDRHEIEHHLGVFLFERPNLIEQLARRGIDVSEPPDHLGVRGRRDLLGDQVFANDRLELSERLALEVATARFGIALIG